MKAVTVAGAVAGAVSTLRAKRKQMATVYISALKSAQLHRQQGDFVDSPAIQLRESLLR